jgi:hypothetical protein
VPTSTDYVKDGATAIETLGDDIDATLYTALGGAYPGLRLVKKQTIGTAVSSVAVTNAFSATYDSYKIIVVGGASTSNIELLFNLTGSSVQYYGGVIFKPFNSTVVSGVASSNGSAWLGGFATTSNITMNIELQAPFLAKTTTFAMLSAVNNSAGSVVFNNGLHDVATSYSGFTITTSTGTLTGGTIYVYGYGAS